jgi:Fur family ferric uptake transcriptional regulator
VHARAQGLLPEISLATVYNTLNELVSMGEVLEIATGPGPKRYDPNAHVEHHHLVCTGCGELRDVQPAGVDRLGIDDADAGGYEVTGVEVVFRGRCPACR